MSEIRSRSRDTTQRASDNQLLDRKTEVDGLLKISKILDCGLDKQALTLLMDLLDYGIDPESLADVILELKSSQLLQKP